MPNRLARPLLGTALLLLWLGVAKAADTAGTVVAVGGQCFVQTDGKRIPLKAGDTVHVTDVLDVPASAKLKLRMTDGSIVSLASDSQLTISAYTIDADGKRREVALSLTQGLLRAVVAAVDRPSTFEIKTAVGAAGARSTDWFVEAQPGLTVVGVLSGSVALTSNSTGHEVVIPAGSGASVAAGQDPTAPRAWRRAEFNALVVRTEQAATRRPVRPTKPVERTEPEEEYNPAPQPPAGGYSPGPGGYGSPPGGSYSPYPGGGYPGGTYQPPSGGYGRSPGGGYNPGSGGTYAPPGGSNPGSGGTYTPPGGSYQNPGSAAPSNRSPRNY
jgi:hypothetical protein